MTAREPGEKYTTSDVPHRSAASSNRVRKKGTNHLEWLTSWLVSGARHSVACTHYYYRRPRCNTRENKAVSGTLSLRSERSVLCSTYHINLIRNIKNSKQVDALNPRSSTTPYSSLFTTGLRSDPLFGRGAADLACSSETTSRRALFRC